MEEGLKKAKASEDRIKYIFTLNPQLVNRIQLTKVQIFVIYKGKLW